MTRHSAPNSVPVPTISESVPASPPALDPLLQRPLRDTPEESVSGVLIAQVVAMDEEEIRVRLPGSDNAEYVARALCPLPEDWQNRECAVLFENGDRTRPLIMGFLLTPHTAPPPLPDSMPEKELYVNGERVKINADTELELRCGESVILLQRDGRIEIRGNYITSQATATQRLRGGSVHIN